MIKKNKTHLFIALTIIVILFIVTATILLLFNSVVLSKNKDKASSIVVNFDSSQEIEIGENLPVSDKLGKSFSITGVEKGVFGYVEFDVTNNSSNNGEFQIYLTKDNYDNEIDGDFIKFYLTDEYGNPYGIFADEKIPNYYNLPVVSDLPASRELYHGSILSNEKQKFKLRVWLSDEYVISKKDNFIKLNVDVRAV